MSSFTIDLFHKKGPFTHTFPANKRKVIEEELTRTNKKYIMMINYYLNERIDPIQIQFFFFF